MRKNPFLLTNTNGKSTKITTNKTFNILNDTNLFPELSSVNKPINEINCSENAQKFKDILVISENDTDTDTDTDKDTNSDINSELNYIKPGFIQIIKNNGKIVIKEGPKLTLGRQQTYNDTINNTISEMIRRWSKYEKEYDELNGEGSYTNKFKMSSVCDEYEYNSDNESNYNENSISDYDEYDYDYEY